MRSGAEIDALVTGLIAERLTRPDALRKEASAGPGAASSGIDAAISEQRARILRARRDYDDEIIEGRDLKRIRDAVEARIAQLEAERLLHGQAPGLAPSLEQTTRRRRSSLPRWNSSGRLSTSSRP